MLSTFKRQDILPRMSTKVVLLLLCLLQTMTPSQSSSSGWIDPDTPWEARTTQKHNPLPFHMPLEKKKQKKKRKKQPGLHAQPSPAPSHSTEAPSQSPSTPPSEYPTYIPRQNFELVFSDEFNTPFRTFQDGTDPRWTALDKNDYTNDALHYYSPKNAATDEQGNLVITSEAAQTDIVGFNDVKLEKTRVVKHFRSAMLQTWNKFCFTGGILEAEVVLPGKHNVGGLWPAFWLLGNLARHTYVGTSEHIWPWSSTMCTHKSFTAQAMSGCDRATHYGLHQGVGRGAPEIDVFEVQPGNMKGNTGAFLKTTVGQPFMSSSFQVAPGRSANRPGNGEWPGPTQWYKGLVPGKNTSLNILFYGNYNHFLNDVHPAQQDYWSDAISMNRQLDRSFFEIPHVYRVEWEPPTQGFGGYLHWFLDGELVFALNGTGIQEAGYGAEISSEPSYILLNTAISKQWGFPLECPANCPCKVYDCDSEHWEHTCGFSEGFCDMIKSRPQYKINWVRVYQDPKNPVHKVGCSTPERPTRRYIEAHEHLYKSMYDVKPMKGVQQGRGSCKLTAVGVVPDACGGDERGRCTIGMVCECRTGWTGPHCLAPHGRDPIQYDEPDSILDVGFVPPRVFPRFLAVGSILLVVLLFSMITWRRRIEGWSPIPSAEVEPLHNYVAQDSYPGQQDVYWT